MLVRHAIEGIVAIKWKLLNNVYAWCFQTSIKTCLSLTAIFQNDGGSFMNITNHKLLYTDVTTIPHAVP